MSLCGSNQIQISFRKYVTRYSRSFIHMVNSHIFLASIKNGAEQPSQVTNK